MKTAEEIFKEVYKAQTGRFVNYSDFDEFKGTHMHEVIIEGMQAYAEEYAKYHLEKRDKVIDSLTESLINLSNKPKPIEFTIKGSDLTAILRKNKPPEDSESMV